MLIDYVVNELDKRSGAILALRITDSIFLWIIENLLLLPLLKMF